ncbi:MAG: hypothetical protein K9M19_00515 [Candidatus Marinimicrobia bacterium]|nr:hypothetical protein [Candidatus Neomarinimicrobiota bacterium]
MIKKIGILCAILLSSGIAQTYLDAIRPFWGMSGRSAARATGDIVGVFDTEALLQNPAALTYITRAFAQIDGSFDHVKGRTLLSSHYLEQRFLDSLSGSQFRFNQVSLALPINVYRGSWVWAGGIQPVTIFDRKGQFSFWDADPSQLVNRKYTLFEEGALYAASLGTAVLFTKELSLGISGSYLFGSNIYTNTYSEEDTDHIYAFARYLDSLGIKADYKGWNLKGGFVLQFPNELLLGGTIETPGILQVEESSEHLKMEIMDDGQPSLYESSPRRIEYKLTGPWRLGVGVSFKYNPLYFTLGYRYHTYSNMSFKSNLIESETDSTYIDSRVNAEISTDLRSTGELMGSMRYFADGGYLQVGLSRQAQPIKTYPGDIFRMDVNLGFTPAPNYEYSLGFQYYSFNANSIQVSALIHEDTGDPIVSIPTDTKHSVTRFMFGVKFYL